MPEQQFLRPRGTTIRGHGPVNLEGVRGESEWEGRKKRERDKGERRRKEEEEQEPTGIKREGGPEGDQEKGGRRKRNEEDKGKRKRKGEEGEKEYVGDHGLLGILKKHVFQDTNPGDSGFGSQSTSFPGKLRITFSFTFFWFCSNSNFVSIIIFI